MNNKLLKITVKNLKLVFDQLNYNKDFYFQITNKENDVLVHVKKNKENIFEIYCYLNDKQDMINYNYSLKINKLNKITNKTKDLKNFILFTKFILSQKFVNNIKKIPSIYFILKNK